MESKITSAHSAHATYLKEQLRQARADLGAQVSLNTALREKNERLSQRLRKRKIESFIWGALFGWGIATFILMLQRWVI